MHAHANRMIDIDWIIRPNCEKMKINPKFKIQSKCISKSYHCANCLNGIIYSDQSSFSQCTECGRSLTDSESDRLKRIESRLTDYLKSLRECLQEITEDEINEIDEIVSDTPPTYPLTNFHYSLIQFKILKCKFLSFKGDDKRMTREWTEIKNLIDNHYSS